MDIKVQYSVIIDLNTILDNNVTYYTMVILRGKDFDIRYT